MVAKIEKLMEQCKLTFSVMISEYFLFMPFVSFPFSWVVRILFADILQIRWDLSLCYQYIIDLIFRYICFVRSKRYRNISADQFKISINKLFRPFLWAQALYIICCLLYDGFLTPAELDPLRRRLSAYEKHPPCEVQGMFVNHFFELYCYSLSKILNKLFNLFLH